MEFSWMWYLNCILDGCYYPRVIGHFKKLYFDQQVYLAVTAFHGGIPPKKLQPIFCSHIKFEFFNCNVDRLYACRKYFKRSRKSSFYWVQIESSTSCTVQIVQVFFGKENVAKTFYWYCFVFYFVTTPFCAFCWIKKMRWDEKSTRVERDEEKMQITDERYVEKALSFTI